MRTQWLTVVLALPLVVLAGCSATVEDVHLTEAPPSAPFDGADGLAEIVVVRPGSAHWMFGFWILINDKRIGSAKSNDYVHHLVEPGIVRIAALADGRCEASFPVEANHTYYVRAKAVSSGGSPKVQLMILDPEEGLAARNKCKDKTRTGL